MSDYRCPWCGHEIEDDDYWECSPEDAYPVECPNCEREFDVSYYLDPVFNVTVPDELEPCAGGCDVWDHCDDCCGFGSMEVKERNAWRASHGASYGLASL